MGKHSFEQLDELLGSLEQICSRPGMYVGCSDLAAVAHYVCGFAHALSLKNPETGAIWSGFSLWIQGAFNISHPNWHWTRILLNHYGSDAVALVEIPVLFRTYLKEAQDIEDLTKWAEQRVFRARGTSCWAPDSQDSSIGLSEA